MRVEAWIAGTGAVVAALVLAGRWAALPEAPAPEPRPRADSLAALTPYLAAGGAGEEAAEGAAGATARENTAGGVRLVRDPFGDGGAAADPDGGAGEPPARGRERWSVSAIMISEDRRLAIVDDRVVEAGDTLAGGARVVDVARDHVTVLGPDGARHRVSLNR